MVVRRSVVTSGKGTSQPRKKGRGPTTMRKAHARTHKLQVNWNKNKQPIGPGAKDMKYFLGTLARDGALAPIDKTQWRDMPEDLKECMWQMCLAKYEMDHSEARQYTLDSIRKKWCNWKSFLRRTVYEVYDNPDDRIANKPGRVLEDQWLPLLRFFDSEEGQARSARNRMNRQKQTILHTAGTKSFAQVCHEEIERRGGKEPSRAELFVITHKRKDKTPVNSHIAEKIQEMEARASQLPEGSTDSIGLDDIYSQVMGRERHGRVRQLGMGPTPSSLGFVTLGSSSGGSSAKQEATLEAKLKEREAVWEAKLKEREVAWEAQQKEREVAWEAQQKEREAAMDAKLQAQQDAMAALVQEQLYKYIQRLNPTYPGEL